MKKIALLFFLAAAAALPARLAAQALPDLKNQAGWKEKDKQDFLKFLKSGQQAPVSGQVKSVANGTDSKWSPRKARYLTLGLASDSIITVNNAGVMKTGAPSFGPELLVGGHMFSWVRYYGGLKYNRINQDKAGGGHSRLAHYEIPVGIELALIPLGTPQTRYVLMRFGVSSHYFANSAAKKTDFNPSLLGWHEAWNVGLGYEWQFAETNWRANILAEGCKSFVGKNSPEFYRAGLTAGLAYTF
ncbi:MAG TPA: hypothetical protein PKI19_09870 [Elusimicrobiales bacterium]|nr:hypothetical protein [Elusimicrobiales bacterium]